MRKYRRRTLIRDDIRRANQSLAVLLTPHHDLAFFCECDDGSCDQRVELDRDLYLSLQERGAGYVVAPHHADGVDRHVVIRGDGYAVVREIRP